MKTIIAILTILGFAFATYFYVDNKYAPAEDLKKVEKRLDYKIVSDQAQSVQERIWKIEDRHPDKSKMDTTTKEEMRTLELKQKELNEKMKTLEK